MALAAWNAGETAVRRHGGKLPPIEETRAHVQLVLELYWALLQDRQSRRATGMRDAAGALRSPQDEDHNDDRRQTMRSTMMDVPLSLNHLLERAGHIFGGNTIVSRLPDKSLRRHTYAEYHRRTRALASALQQLGLQQGRARRHAVLEPPRPPGVPTSASRPPAA